MAGSNDELWCVLLINFGYRCIWFIVILCYKWKPTKAFLLLYFREGKKHVQEHEKPSESHIIEMETNQHPPTSGEFLSPGQSQGSGITPYNMQSRGAQQFSEHLKGQFQQQAGVTSQAFGENIKPTLLQLCGQTISHHDCGRGWVRQQLNSQVNEASHDSQDGREEIHGVTSQQPALVDHKSKRFVLFLFFRTNFAYTCTLHF